MLSVKDEGHKFEKLTQNFQLRTPQLAKLLCK
jgi:hypothetical protein